VCAQHDMESSLGSSDSSLLACLSIYQAASFFGAMPSSSSTDPVLGREDDDDDEEQDEAVEEVVRWRRNASVGARTNHMLGWLPVSVLRVWFVHWVCIFDSGLLHRDDW
jgi:hypothetical protein